MPQGNQPAVHQPALPRDKQAGPELALPQNRGRTFCGRNPQLNEKCSHPYHGGRRQLPDQILVNSTASGAGANAQPQTHSRTHQLSKWTAPVIPSFIPTQALTPRTKVLLDRSGLEREKRGLVSPATKLAGDRPQRASSKKWWRPPSSNGTSEGLGQTEGILTSILMSYAFRKRNWTTHPIRKHTSVPTMTASTKHWGGDLSSSLEEYPYIYIYIYIKGSLPQAHPHGYSPSGCSGAGHTGKHTCQYPFCFHTKAWTPYNPRPLTPN